ncbi:MAG TPA: tetratricopeptide repeat protein [Steroidobacteraceae bacterium]|nr:tetratricopeptide repeat protein [Steroidobacteraceae bacterium]
MISRGRRSSRAILLGIAVVCGAVVNPLLAREPTEPQPHRTIGDLIAHPTEVQPDEPTGATDAKAMENYRSFLELQNTDPRLRAEAMRRLGDLSLESGQLERMEKELGTVDPLGAEAIQLYTVLLKAYPNYPRNDEVLYQLARAYETTGRPDDALATLDRLESRYPHTRLIAEVEFRRGELLFSAKRYAEAEAAYGSVIRRGTASGFYRQSLYKQGWSLFKQSKNEESLPAFAGVLDQALLEGRSGGRPVPLESLSRANRELVEDTLRAMSITFSYLEGSKSIDAFLGRYGERPYDYLLYARLGDLYVTKQRYQDAATTYRAYVARSPASDHAPGLAMQAIEAYRKGGFTQLVLDGKREYLERYDLGTEFWRGRKPADYPQVVGELKKNLQDVATYYHAMAQSKKRIEDYREAARWYRAYLKDFPDDPDSATTDYRLADALFASGQYVDAASEYERTAYHYPLTASSAAAAYAALVSYQKAEATLSGSAKAALHARAIDSGIRFARAFPTHPDSGGVLTRAAEDLFNAHDARATEVAHLVLDHRPPVDPEKQRIAWTIIGQSSFDHGAFADAESAYTRARELAARDPKMRADLTDRIAAAVYQQGAAKQKAGDSSGAVAAFLRVGEVAPSSKIHATAQYDAAAELIRLKQWDRAVTVLEQYRHDFPKDSRAADVTRKLAVAYVEAKRPGAAAAEFERIAATSAEAREVRREALQRAADLYADAHEPGKSQALLVEFVKTYPEPIADAIEARERLATAAQKAGDERRALDWDRQIVQADAHAGAARTARTRYLAAHAALALAAPERDAFRRIRLVAPLKRSLIAKRKALERALADYKATLAYQVADVTTASTYEMAELYRTLAKDLLASERPKRLSKDELDQYEALLEDQANPFEEQAIALHEANTARARDGLYDEWVKKSYAALAELDPGRYGKTELTQDVVATLY